LQRLYVHVYLLPEPPAFIPIIFIVTNVYILKLVAGTATRNINDYYSLEWFKSHSVFVLVRTV